MIHKIVSEWQRDRMEMMMMMMMMREIITKGIRARKYDKT